MALDGILEAWSRLAELWWTRHGAAPPDGLARGRLDLLLRYAREFSPYYRRLYDGLPDDPPLEALPRTTSCGTSTIGRPTAASRTPP